MLRPRAFRTVRLLALSIVECGSESGLGDVTGVHFRIRRRKFTGFGAGSCWIPVELGTAPTRCGHAGVPSRGEVDGGGRRTIELTTVGIKDFALVPAIGRGETRVACGVGCRDGLRDRAFATNDLTSRCIGG